MRSSGPLRVAATCKQPPTLAHRVRAVRRPVPVSADGAGERPDVVEVGRADEHDGAVDAELAEAGQLACADGRADAVTRKAAGSRPAARMGLAGDVDQAGQAGPGRACSCRRRPGRPARPSSGRSRRSRWAAADRAAGTRRRRRSSPSTPPQRGDGVLDRPASGPGRPAPTRPNASCSAAYGVSWPPPAPRPSSSRPPLTSCRVAAITASVPGSRLATFSTSGPIARRGTAAATRSASSSTRARGASGGPSRRGGRRATARRSRPARRRPRRRARRSHRRAERVEQQVEEHARTLPARVAAPAGGWRPRFGRSCVGIPRPDARTANHPPAQRLGTHRLGPGPRPTAKLSGA